MNNFYSEIKKIQTDNCSSSLDSVIERYTPVFLSMYSKFFFAMRESGADPSDILEDKDLIIYEAAKSFNLDKGSSFCTWLSNNTKYKCLHLINKTKKSSLLQERVRNNNETSLNNLNKNVFKLKELNSHIFSILDSLRDKRIMSVYKLRYFSGNKMTWSKIGKSLGFSSQTAINLHARGADILKKKINKINP